MFDNLVESRRKRSVKKALPSTLMSLAFHVGLIYAAIMATMKAKEVVQKLTSDTTMVYIQQQKQQPKQPPPPKIVTLNPPPKGFQNLTAPIDIPKEIPPVNLNERFDPRDYSGVGVEGGIATGVVGGTGPVDLTQVFEEGVVDEIPMRLSGPPLRYPQLLQDAQIEGTVVIEVVIDTTGHPEPNTIKVISSTNAGFVSAAKEEVLGSVYRPGKLHGQPVQVWIRQPVRFTITK